MKLGICGGPAQIADAKALGYDYFETAATTVAAMTDEEFTAFAAVNDAARDGAFAGVLTCNGLFPGDLALVGEHADMEKIAAYLRRLIPRLQRLGVKKQVFGSGGARRCPEGADAAAVDAQLLAVAKMAADLFEAAGIALGMEHLNHNETNTLNTFVETVDFARRTGSATLGVTLDFYHLGVENEPLTVLAPGADRIAHCHTAAPDRKNVKPQDVAVLTAQIRALQAAGYNDTLSVEAVFADYMADGAAYLQVLRGAVN